MRFYLTENASRAVELGGKKFVFEAAEYFAPTLSWWGILAAEEGADTALLGQAVSKGVIHEITAAEYAVFESKKKTRQSSPNIIDLKHWHAPQMGGPAAAPAVEVSSPGPAIETLVDAIATRPAK